MKNHSKKTIPDEFKGGRHLNAITENKNIRGIGKAILHDIASFCDLGENATFQEWRYRSKSDLVRRTGFGLKAINDNIKFMIKDGYLLERQSKREDGGDAANDFRFTSKIFDEYLSNQLSDTTEGGDTNSYGGGDTNSYGGGDTNSYPNHNEAKHNEINHNQHSVVTSVDHSSACARMIEEIEIIQSLHDEPKPANERSDKPKKVLTDFQNKSVTLCLRVFNFGDRDRTSVYQWMDKLRSASAYGDARVGKAVDLIEKKNGKVVPSAKNMNEIVKFIELTKEQVWT